MIIIISGSPRGEKSVSTESAKQIAELSGQPYQLYDASSWHIDYCNACNNCVRDGRCTLESGDDFDSILRDLHNADGLILASPVYCGNYTAQLKTLIDRLAPDLHTMTLLGKPAVVLAVSDSSYEERTAESLSELLEYAGAEIVDTVLINGKTKKDEKKERLNAAAALLQEALSDAHSPALSDRTMTWFKKQTVQYRVLLKLADCFPEIMGEAKMWQSLGYSGCSDAREAAVMRRRLNGSNSSLKTD
ncbi:MAG: flavodoxin family protein [Eubacteriales bacterium]|nr:flavodoxin family protein [Eubacteriales bacterium]